MQLKHTDIWRAIDRLAENNNLSPSSLAKKAGLSPTVFNPSKRSTASRKRWPSTESIARILQATGTSLEDFVLLASADSIVARHTLPLLGYAQAGRKGFFDEAGYPVGSGWEEINFPAVADAHAFALEVSGRSMEPLYREGDRIVLAPGERPRKGDRVVVRTKKGEVLAKELGRESAKVVELISLNPEHGPVNLALADIEWMYRIVWASQ